MSQLRQDYNKFVNAETEIIAVGPEQQDKFAAYFDKEALPFRGIADPEHKIGDLYGQEVSLIKLGRMPAQFLIDKRGVICHVKYGASMKDIPDNQEILAEIERVNRG